MDGYSALLGAVLLRWRHWVLAAQLVIKLACGDAVLCLMADKSCDELHCNAHAVHNRE